jgi:hypothetical protein
VLYSSSGLPYLAPGLQLLPESRSPRPNDDLDTSSVTPFLDQRRRRDLFSRLASEHPWHTLISDS